MSKRSDSLLAGLMGSIKPELIEKINALPEDADVPAEIIDETSGALADWHFEHDKARLEAVRKDNTGRQMALFSQKISKAFGISPKEFEGKATIEEWLSAAVGKIKADSGLSEDERTKALEAAKAEAMELKSRLEQYDSELIPQLKADADSKVRQYRLNQSLTAAINKYPLVGAPGFITKGLIEELGRKYVIDFDGDTDNVVITTKDGARVPKPGTKEFKSLDEIVLEEGTAAGAFAKSNAGKHPEGNPPAGNGKPAPPAPSGKKPMTEVERNIEAAKQAAARV